MLCRCRFIYHRLYPVGIRNPIHRQTSDARVTQQSLKNLSGMELRVGRTSLQGGLSEIGVSTEIRGLNVIAGILLQEEACHCSAVPSIKYQLTPRSDRENSEKSPCYFDCILLMSRLKLLSGHLDST